MRRARHMLAFGDLEQDPLQRPIGTTRGRQGPADAVFRLVHRIGQEVDRYRLPHAERGGGLDRGDPAGLVEGVQAVIGNGRDHRSGRRAVGTAHQRLVCEHLAAAEVDDRLVGHRDGNRQLAPFAAGLAGGFAGHGCS